MSQGGVAGAAVLSAASTVTVKSMCALLRLASVAVHVTGVAPIANKLPDAGVQVAASVPS